MTATWLEVPAPEGDLETIESSARSLRGEAGAVRTQLSALRAATSETLIEWQGEAAQSFAFKEKVAEESLGVVATSFDRAAAQMEAYASAWSKAHQASTTAHDSVNDAIDRYVSGVTAALGEAVQAIGGFLSGAAGLMDAILPGDQSALVAFAHRLSSWSPPTQRAELTIVGGMQNRLDEPGDLLSLVRAGSGWGVSHLLEGAGWVADMVGASISWAWRQLQALEEAFADAVTAALRVAYDAVNALIELGASVAKTIARIATDILTAVWKATVRAVEAVAGYQAWLLQQALEAGKRVLDLIKAGALVVLRTGLEEFLEFLHDDPWFQEALTRVAPWLVQGFAFRVAALFGGAAGVLFLIIGTEGRWPAASYEGAVEGLQNLASKFGCLDDAGVEYAAGLKSSVYGEDTPWDLNADGSPITKLLDLEANKAYQTVDDRAVPGIVVTVVVGPDGVKRYIVNIPGTEGWGMSHGDNPFDATSNVALMSNPDAPPAVVRAVEAAMRRAGVPLGAEVMLVGHSQGGIIAAYMAEHQRTFHVNSIVTAESPIGRFHIPPDVDVLALEERNDIVPRLDGVSNPQRANYQTYMFDRQESDLAAAHGGFDLAAADLERDGWFDEWKARNAEFFGSGIDNEGPVRVQIVRTP